MLCSRGGINYQMATYLDYHKSCLYKTQRNINSFRKDRTMKTSEIIKWVEIQRAKGLTDEEIIKLFENLNK